MQLRNTLLALLAFSALSSATVYEDAQDATTKNWRVHDAKPAGAIVENVYNKVKKSRVIELKGDRRRNAYFIGAKSRSSANSWNNSKEHTLSWSMNFNERFKLTLYVQTKKGLRRFYFTHRNRSVGLYKKGKIHIGLGKKSRLGSWKHFSFDIAKLLKKYEPHNKLLSINGLKVQGSGLMDDIALTNKEDNSTTPIKPKYGKDAFVATWKIGKEKSLQLALSANFYNFNFTVDWGDGTINKNLSKKILHTYDKEGTYTVIITGSYPSLNGMCYRDTDDEGHSINLQHLVSVEQWGTQKWKTMLGAFADCKEFNAINDPKAPDLSEVKDMSYMFEGATVFNQSIGHWDVSNVENMDSMFSYAKAFNQDLSGWDTSNVTYMLRMFLNASSFNQDISMWNISKAQNGGITLSGTSFSTENYDKLLIAWSKFKTRTVSISANNTKYSAKVSTIRQNLIDNYNWHIVDKGVVTP